MANKFDHLTGTERASAPSTPATGDWAIYFKSDGFYVIDDTGTETGPFGSAADLSAHLADTSDAHDASAISYAGGTGMSATDVEAAIDELATEKADLASPTFTGEPVAPSFQASGLTGATATPIRLAGGTASGAPASGAHLKGEIVWDDAGVGYYCTVAGTPGTWVSFGGGGGGSVATDAIWDAAGDLAVGTGANTAARVAKGTALQVLRVNAAGTALEWADPTGGSSVPTETQTQQSAGLTTATTAYSVGDQLGSILTFTSMASGAGGTGVITGVALTDMADVIGAVDLWLFPETVTLASDNAAFSLSDADTRKAIGCIQVPAAYDAGGARASTINGLSVPYHCTATSLFVAMVTQTGHTFFAAATDLEVRFYYKVDG